MSAVAALDAPIRDGLERVDALKPGEGFLDLTAGARGNGAGWAGFARGELGVKLAPSASAFAFGEAEWGAVGPAWQTGIGVRATW